MAVNTTYQNQVQTMYIAYFGRPADPTALDYYTNLMAAQGGSYAALNDDFFNSSESTGLYTTLGLNAKINAFYQNLFGHDADVDGLAYWVGLVNNQVVTLPQVAYTIAYNAGTADAAILAAKQSTAAAYTAALDTTAERLAYEANATAGRTFLTTVTTSTPATAAAVTAATTTLVSGTTTNPGQTFTLTAGADTGTAFVGGTNNDTFNASTTTAGGAAADTWTVGDAIDGGAGDDTFNVTQTNNIVKPTGATVTNIETINLLSGGTVTLDTSSGFSGLTALNSTSTGGAVLTAAATTDVTVTESALSTTGNGGVLVNGGKNVTVSVTAADATHDGTQTTADVEIAVGATTAAAGTVNVTNTGKYADGSNNSMSTIAVVGGTEITVTNVVGLTSAQTSGQSTDASNFTVTQGAVFVTGNASTTTVTVNQAAAVTEVDSTGTNGKIGIAGGAVTIADANAASLTAAGTLTTVNLKSYGSSTIDSGALTTLNLSGASGSASTLSVTAGALTTATVNALAINLNGLTAGNLTLDADYKTLNITGSTTASTVADLTSTGATAVNVAGDAKVTFTDQSLTNANLATITVTNTAGGVFGTTAIGTSTLFTGGAGADGVVLASTTKAITMGAGNDKVTTTTGLVGTGGSVNAGDGTDTIAMTGVIAAVADDDSTFNSKFTNFETLELTSLAGETIALAGINAVSNVVVAASSSTVTLNNFKSGGTLTSKGTNTTVTLGVDNATFNATDTVNIVLSNSTGAVDAFGTFVAAGVETVTITTQESSSSATAATIDTATLQATSAETVTVTGNNGLTLTNTGNTAITSFDASGVAGDDSTDTATNLAVTFASANTDATATVAIKGGAGNDSLTGFVGKDQIVGGAGVDTITGGKGIDTLTGGAGADIFVFSTAAGSASTFTNVDTTANQDAEQITFSADSADTDDEVITVTYTVDGTQYTTANIDLTGIVVTTASAVAGAVATALNGQNGITAANGGTAVVTAYVGDGKTLVIDSVNTAAGTIAWTVAPAIADSATDQAEVDTATLGTVAIGDVITATVNGTTYSYTALTTTPADALDGLVLLVNAGSSAVVTAARSGATTMTLTATAAQVELGGFTATTAVTSAGMDTGVTTTAGFGADSITDFNTGGSDIIRIDAANNVAGVATADAVATATVKISTGGKVTFAAEDDTFAEMLAAVAADNTNVANNEVVFFENGGDTYIYIAGTDTTNAAVDSLIKLVGVTGLTTLTESGATPGDFTLA